MSNDPLDRALPVALALTLISLTALWGGWMIGQGASLLNAPSALIVMIWPPLALAVWRASRPGAARQVPSPDTQRESASEAGAELAGLTER